jgi:hypothetical protein
MLGPLGSPPLYGASAAPGVLAGLAAAVGAGAAAVVGTVLVGCAALVGTVVGGAVGLGTLAGAVPLVHAAMSSAIVAHTQPTARRITAYLLAGR